MRHLKVLRSGIAAGGIFYYAQSGTPSQFYLKIEIKKFFVWLHSSSPNCY
jgi:hypothetical protein